MIIDNSLIFKIHNGTARSDQPNLCVTCRSGYRTIGANTGKQTIYCLVHTEPLKLHEPIVSCSVYSDKTKPSLYDYQEIAWTLMTDKGGRKLGFQAPNKSSSLPSTLGF